MSQSVSELVILWMNEWTNEWISQSVSQWMNEWKDEWMDGRMDEWMNRSINQSVSQSSNQFINVFLFICAFRYGKILVCVGLIFSGQTSTICVLALIASGHLTYVSMARRYCGCSFSWCCRIWPYSKLDHSESADLRQGQSGSDPKSVSGVRRRKWTLDPDNFLNLMGTFLLKVTLTLT